MARVYKIVPLRRLDSNVKTGEFALVINNELKFTGTEKECLWAAVGLMDGRK